MICKLCGYEKELKESHIIPRAIYKDLKRESGQLISVVCDDITIPRRTNSNPKERLLCGECETFLCEEYEKYGTRLFKSSTGVKHSKSYVELTGFKYVDYYLYLISILWRASISTLPEFEVVKLGEEFELILNQCIRQHSIELETSLKLDHLLKISIFRVVDNNGNIDDYIIKSMILNFGVELGRSVNEGRVYSFMINGFFICYYINAYKDIHQARTSKIHGQLKNHIVIRIPKIEIGDIKRIYDVFSTVIEKSKLHSFKRG